MNSKQFGFTVAEVSQLFRMQDTLNSYIHPEWKLQGFNWYDAIADECQEILGHLGWKWWKENYQCGITLANKEQLKLEVIDLIHFIVSLAVVNNEDSAERFCADLNAVYISRLDSSSELELATRQLRGQGYDMVACLVAMAHSLDMTTEEILSTYLHKFVLNKFRQDHGYKDGTYDKHWELQVFPSGIPDSAVAVMLEDNEVLARAVEYLSGKHGVTIDEQTLYSELEFRYNGRLNKPSVG